MARARVSESDYKSLSKDLQAEYVKQEDGTYLLKVDEVDGWALEDVRGLKSTLQAKKDEIKALKETVLKYKDIDPDEARKAMEKLNELGNLSKDDKVKQLVEDTKAQLVKKHAGELEAERKKTGSVTAQLEKALRSSAREAALAKHKGKAKLLAGVVDAQTKVEAGEDGQYHIRVVDAEGKTRMSMRQGRTDPMDVDELVETLKKDPDYSVAFEGTGAAGAGSSGSGGKGSGGGGTKVDRNLSPGERLKAIREAKASGAAA